MDLMVMPRCEVSDDSSANLFVDLIKNEYPETYREILESFAYDYDEPRKERDRYLKSFFRDVKKNVKLAINNPLYRWLLLPDPETYVETLKTCNVSIGTHWFPDFTGRKFISILVYSEEGKRPNVLVEGKFEGNA